MSYNSRKHSSENTRTVSYNSSGLNERFSKIVRSATTQNRSTTGPVAATNRSGSVFSRLRGGKTAGRVGATNIQNRLGKLNNGGIKKKRGGPTPMEGVQRQRGAAGRVSKPVVGRNKATVVGSKQGKKPQQNQQQKKKVAKKPLTAEELDKALEKYMMKDPKTAQAMLDAEITSYMDEAGDILMEEETAM